MSTYFIGTRKSPLAISQAELLKNALQNAHPQHAFELKYSEASGDRDTVGRLGSHGGKGGAFIADIRKMLERHDVDLVMHSLKDLPGNQEYYDQPQYCLGAYLKRGDPRDCLVLRPGEELDAVLTKGIIGTNSVRRKAILRHRFPSLKVVHSRGAIIGANDHDKSSVPLSRLGKLDRGIPQKLPYGNADVGDAAQGLVIAFAGLQRLGLDNRADYIFPIDEMCPAVGQGVVVAECLTENTEVRSLLAKVNHEETRVRCFAERAMIRALDGNCHSPIAGYAWIKDGKLRLRGVILHPDGGYYSSVERQTDILSPEDLGELVANELIRRGGKDIIQMSRLIG